MLEMISIYYITVAGMVSLVTGGVIFIAINDMILMNKKNGGK